MDPTQIMVVARGIERLFINAAAILSIYFGYKLFRAGIDATQIGDIKFLRWTVALKQVGPGIFFALFGTIVLSVSVMNAMKFENNFGESEKTAARTLETQKGAFMGSADPQVTRSQVRALTAAIGVASCDRVDACPDMIPLKSAKTYLDTLRTGILQKQFGDDVLIFWNSNKERLASGQVKDAKDLRRLQEM